jgi:iron complex outermembrane receptor protein
VFGILGAPFSESQDTTGKSTSYAGYLDVNWEIFDRWRVSVGGRYTHDKKENINKPNPLLLDGAQAEKSWDKFTPKLGIDFRPNDDVMVYASYQRGYRSGGFNGRGQTLVTATTPYDPETVDAYEIGLKSEFFDRRVALNLAAFYSDYQDMQQSTTISLAGSVGNETIVTNASTADIQGLEADITWQPIDDLTFRSSIGYTDAEFGDFITNLPVAGVDLDNNGVDDALPFDMSNVDLIYAPEITFAVSGDYTIPLDWGAGAELRLNASYRYLSEYDQQIAPDPATPINVTGITVVEQNDPRLRSDTQSLIDASISMEWSLQNGDSKARLTLFGRNLADDRGTQTAFTVAAFPTLWAFAHSREPRTYGVQVGFEF